MRPDKVGHEVVLVEEGLELLQRELGQVLLRKFQDVLREPGLLRFRSPGENLRIARLR